jgi:hypothetical protein
MATEIREDRCHVEGHVHRHVVLHDHAALLADTLKAPKRCCWVVCACVVDGRIVECDRAQSGTRVRRFEGQKIRQGSNCTNESYILRLENE